MKFKSLFLILAVCFFSGSSFAQAKKFNIEISMPDNYWLTLKNNTPVKVKITNKSERELNTEQIAGISFYFSKCPQISKCGKRGDKFVAHSEVENKGLKKDASFEFEVNIADLYWMDAVSGNTNLNEKEPKNFEIISSDNKYFYAVVKTRSKYLNEKVMPGKSYNYESYESNEIILELKLNTTK